MPHIATPWGCEESDTTEQLHFHFSLSCVGEGNGNPLQCSCLENPRVGGAWWASVYGVAQSRTQLKRLSSSSSSIPGPRSLVDYSPWGHEESDTTERLHFTSPALQADSLPRSHQGSCHVQVGRGLKTARRRDEN